MKLLRPHFNLVIVCLLSCWTMMRDVHCLDSSGTTMTSVASPTSVAPNSNNSNDKNTDGRVLTAVYPASTNATLVDVAIADDGENATNSNKSSQSGQAIAVRNNSSSTSGPVMMVNGRPVLAKYVPKAASSDMSAMVVAANSQQSNNGAVAALTTAKAGNVETTAAVTTVPPPITTTLPAYVLAKWSYDEVDNWDYVSPVCEEGWRQSPVELNVELATTNSRLNTDPLVFTNYAGLVAGNLTNNGNYLVWSVDGSVRSLPTITGSGYSAPGYVLDHVAFHWGADNVESDCTGSDHVVDYYPAPLEVHFVHRNAKYPTYYSALPANDGIAIIAFLFQAVDDSVVKATTAAPLNLTVTTPMNASAVASSNVTVASSPAISYADVVHSLEEVARPNATTALSLDLAQVLPSFTKGGIFYRYDGSLTMPPCFETVSWTVYRDRISMPVSQLKAFRQTLKKKIGNSLITMENNHRSIQMRNSRPIWTNGKGFARSEASKNFVSMVSMLFFMSASAFLLC